MTATWDDIFGSMAAIGIHHTSYTGRMSLTAELLGVKVTDAVQAVIRFGSIRLLPEEAYKNLSACVSAARDTLHRNSVKFAMIPGSRLVRLDKLDELISQLKMCKIAYDAAKEEFRANFYANRDKQLPILRAAFSTALEVEDAETPEEAAARLKLLDHVMTIITANYPSADEAADRFSLRWSSPFSIDRSKKSVSEDDVQAELADVKDVLKGIIEELRSDLSERVKDLRDLIMRGGKITKKTTNSARDAIGRLRDLNIVNDTVLLAQIEAVELWLNRLDSNAADAVTNGIVVGLDEVMKAVESDADVAAAAASAALSGAGKRKLTLPTKPTQEAA